MRPVGVLLFFLLPALAEASGIDDWRRVNIDSLGVRERPGKDYKKIDTFPKDLPVMVKETYQGWCAIDYRGLPVVWSNGIHSPLGKYSPAEHHGGYWVRCDKLIPFEPVEHIEPQVSLKHFLYLEHTLWGQDVFGTFLTSGMKGYLKADVGTYFQVVSEQGGKATVVNYDGNTITPTDSMINASRIVALKWDMANNLPIYIPPPPTGSLYVRYVSFAAIMLDNRRLWWILFALSAGLGFCSSMGRRNERDMPGTGFFGLLAVALLVGSCQGNNLNQYKANVAHLEQSTNTFSHLNFAGKTLPFGWESLPGNRARGQDSLEIEIGGYVWIPLFMLAHIVLIFGIPRIVRGAHFLLSSPPDVPALLDRASAGKSPPPAWVSQNWIRHLNAREAKIKSRIAAIKAQNANRLARANRVR